MQAKEDYKPYTIKYDLINIYKETSGRSTS